MKSKRDKKKTIIPVAFLLFLCFNMIQKDNNIFNQITSIPKTADTNLIWDLSLYDSPDYVEISDDAQYIAAADYGGEYVTLFNSTNSNVIWNYSLSSTSIRGMDMSANGEYIIVGCQNNYVHIFNNTPDSSKTPFWSYNTGEIVIDVAISTDGNFAVAGTSGTNDYVILFNVTNPLDPFIWQSAEPTDAVQCVAISSNGTYIVAGASSYLYMYEKSSPTAQWSDSTTGYKYVVAISANGNYIATGGQSGYVYLYNRSISTDLWEYSLPGDVFSIDMSDDGEYFVTGSANGKCALFNKTGLERYYIVDATENVLSVSISNDGNYVAAGYEYASSSGRDTIYFYERTSSTALWTQKTLTSMDAVTLSSNGSYLVACEGLSGNRLYFFSTLTVLEDPFNLSSNYSLIGTTFVYELLEWNETLGDSLNITLADILPTVDVGEQRCYEITQITEYTDYWTISYKAWDWGSDFNANTPYTNSIDIYFNPIDEGLAVDYIHPDLMSIIPQPVEDYLEGIDWSSDSSNSGLNYIYENTISSHTFNLIVNYDTNGYLKSMNWTYNDDILLIIAYMGERSATSSTSIPFSEYYLLVTFSSIGMVILIVIRKQKIKTLLM